MLTTIDPPGGGGSVPYRQVQLRVAHRGVERDV